MLVAQQASNILCGRFEAGALEQGNAVSFSASIEFTEDGKSDGSARTRSGGDVRPRVAPHDHPVRALLLRQLEVLLEVLRLNEDGGAVGEVGGGQRVLRRAAAGLLATPHDAYSTRTESDDFESRISQA